MIYRHIYQQMTDNPYNSSNNDVILSFLETSVRVWTGKNFHGTQNLSML